METPPIEVRRTDAAMALKVRLLPFAVGLAGAGLTANPTAQRFLVLLLLVLVTAKLARRTVSVFQIVRVVSVAYGMGTFALVILRIHTRLYGPFDVAFHGHWTQWANYAALGHVLFMGTLMLTFMPCFAYALGVWNGRIREMPPWSKCGWVIGGTIVGAYFGGLLGLALTPSNRATIMMVSEMLVGAVIGLWLGIRIDSQLQHACSDGRSRLIIGGLQLVIFLALSVAVLILRSHWLSVTLR